MQCPAIYLSRSSKIIFHAFFSVLLDFFFPFYLSKRLIFSLYLIYIGLSYMNHICICTYTRLGDTSDVVPWPPLRLFLRLFLRKLRHILCYMSCNILRSSSNVIYHAFFSVLLNIFFLFILEFYIFTIFNTFCFILYESHMHPHTRCPRGYELCITLAVFRLFLLFGTLPALG